METIQCEDDIHKTYQSAVSNLPMAAVRYALNFKTVNYYYYYTHFKILSVLSFFTEVKVLYFNFNELYVFQSIDSIFGIVIG